MHSMKIVIFITIIVRIVEYNHLYAVILWKKETESRKNNKTKEWRKERDLTRDALTKKGDVHCTTLAKMENDVINNPSLRTIAIIANGVNMTLDDLVK